MCPGRCWRGKRLWSESGNSELADPSGWRSVHSSDGKYKQPLTELQHKWQHLQLSKPALRTDLQRQRHVS